MRKRPLTIENRWDILYRDFPEIYDEFAAVPYTPRMMDVLGKMFEFSGKVVLDAGSGTGESAFAVSQAAARVIGLEIENSMRLLANELMMSRGYRNVSFVEGDVFDMPFKDRCFDIVMAITLPLTTSDEVRRFAQEAQRVVKDDGVVISLCIAPKWYGGELAPIILGESRKTEVDTEGLVDSVLVNECGFSYCDYYTVQEYGSLDKIVRTYGFIFGKKAIHYVKEHSKTSIQWKIRIHHK